MRYSIVLNDDAGTPGKSPPGGAPDELREAFARAGAEVDVSVAEPGRIDDALKAALRSRSDGVIVGGGDGTVRSAAALLADTGVPLGVLPMGTFNHFAKDLQIPVNLAEAVPALVGGVTRDLDLGEVNGHVFINNCSFGAYAEAIRRRDSLRNRHGAGKWWAMARASWEEFRRLRRLRLLVGVEHGAGGRELGAGRSERATSDVQRPTLREEARGAESGGSGMRRVKTPAIMIGNNRYSGHLLSQNLRPRLDEGRLWLYTVQARRQLEALRMVLQTFVRRLDEIDSLAAEPALEIMIVSECGPVPVAADGELLDLRSPFRVSIRPGALRVIVPRDARDAKREAQGGKGAELSGKGEEVAGRPQPALNTHLTTLNSFSSP